jgi:hypothetical protein
LIIDINSCCAFLQILILNIMQIGASTNPEYKLPHVRVLDLLCAATASYLFGFIFVQLVFNIVSYLSHFVWNLIFTWSRVVHWQSVVVLVLGILLQFLLVIRIHTLQGWLWLHKFLVKFLGDRVLHAVSVSCWGISLLVGTNEKLSR